MVLDPSRGTKFYRNSNDPLHIHLSIPQKGSTAKILLIHGEHIAIQKVNLQTEIIPISPHQEYLLANLSQFTLTIEFDHDPNMHEILFDPYRYEQNPYGIIDPEEFRNSQIVPDGYMDILPKWYSIKFTYPTRNLIYIRPQLGLSIQAHRKRTEDWKVIQGHPLVIANSRIHYSVHPGDTFHTEIGKFHAIFNNTNSWAVIEEHYSGKFEEEDIIRVFNPNHYH